MNSYLYRSRYILLGAVVVISLAILGGWVYAQMNSGATIQACVNSQNGNTRIVDNANQCRQNEYPVQWNVTGPPGPAGPQGSPGLSGYYLAGTSGTVSGNGAIQPTVVCPAGKKVVSGGIYVSYEFRDHFTTVASYPLADFSGWRVLSRYNDCTDSTRCWYNIYAICANVD
jgi:hypothetical protein